MTERMAMMGQEQAFGNNAAPLNGVITGRPMFASVDVQLGQGEEMIADAGAMLWMDASMQVTTEMRGGCFQAIGRECAGESCCINTFAGPGKVGLGFDLPGDMLPFAVAPGAGWILSKGAFIGGTNNITVSARFAGCFACLCSGEGPFLTKITCEEGLGMFYAGGYGAITRHDIPAGQQFFVDNGLFFASNDKTKINIGIVGGAKGMCCSGEGVVMKFWGPTSIYTQSRDESIFDPAKKYGQSNDPNDRG
jgi:uncharacterized protein (TIGR00266 family)